MTISSSKPKRSRLFSRRELRQRGTRVVREGSINRLQPNSRKYRFAMCASSGSSQNSAPSQQSSCMERNQESIDAYSEHSAHLNGDDSDAIVQAPSAGCGDAGGSRVDQTGATTRNQKTPGIRRKKKMHPITRMSERARRLRVSPTSQLGLASIRLRPDTISPPSSPTRLPPPLNLDRSISSFPRQSPERAAMPYTHGAAANPAAPSPWKGSRRSSHLTPLRQVRDRLKPTREKPPPVFTLPKA
ncbi:hypothetical protein GQ54DRAFT_40658 [Martensiomyces pterosporus]|nr:hypothetical protein GQ54DRAFT_40658 [Martensiomyces pterosporus]